MYQKNFCVFILLLYIKPDADLTFAMQMLNHQTEMSEYCRRRVVPSIFLGKQVMEASSHTMHFSQLEIPYSCTISVRTEAGSNIILVIQLVSDINLLEECIRNRNQLIVYEFAETFGGYWGHLPDKMLKETTKNYTQFYTLRTTKTVTAKSTETYDNDTEKAVLKQTLKMTTDKEQEYIRMEVPLVNVSGNFQLGSPRETYNADEMFDFIYDVAPKNGVEYKTSLLPLVQFSIKQVTDAGVYGGEVARRYELDYAINGFTLDSRLLFSTSNKRMSTRRKIWNSNRRYNFGKKNTPLFTNKEKTLNFHRLFPRRKSIFLPPNSTIKKSVTKTLHQKSTTVWDIEDLLNKFNLTTTQNTMTNNVTIVNILSKISNMRHNSSVYLVPNLSVFKNIDSPKNKKLPERTNSNLITKNILPSTEFSSRSSASQKSHSSTVMNKLDMITLVSKERPGHHTSTDVDLTLQNLIVHNNSTYTETEGGVYTSRQNVNVTKVDDLNKQIRNDSKKSSNFQRGNLVDHESWENIVQAAPVMAVVLNKNETFNKETSVIGLNQRKQKKRHIHALDIEKSRPRNLTTLPMVTTGTRAAYQFSDMEDLARLVELQDDEVVGRLALRYLRNYVGPTVFNICDFKEAKTQQVHIINASRIVVSLNNFTLEGMTILMTPAYTLLNTEAGCEPGHLECQITGTRVCIDSMNACDAVPNCGSYDIYDEDRLKCGVTQGLQHNVYLAAFTFLAVIVTMLYTVHYWLKRCVPKVSDAFFTYTDASENTLFLDTIMRSPTAGDDDSYKIAFPERFFTDNALDHEFKKADSKDNFCTKILRKYCKILFCMKKGERKDSASLQEEYTPAPGHSKIFSFTEFELRKFAQSSQKDEAIQTGGSIEMPDKNLSTKRRDEIQDYRHKGSHTTTHETFDGRREQQKHTDELSLLKFTKESRSLSHCDVASIERRELGNMLRRHAMVAEDEKELKSTFYERPSIASDTPEKIQVKAEVHPARVKPVKGNKDSAKHLRFDEELTMIPSGESDGQITVSTMGSRRSVVLDSGKQNTRNLNANTGVEKTGSSSSRDFMRFWENVRGKKAKNKKEKHLPIR